jgi:uncharacterized protein
MTDFFQDSGKVESLNVKPLPWAQRNGFPDWLTASFWLIVAFIGFQVIANVLALLFVLAQEGFNVDPAQLMQLISQHMRWVFVGNSIGQVSVLAIATWLFSSFVVFKKEKKSFFRFIWNEHTSKTLLLSFLIMICIQPTIWFLGYLNQLIPFSDSYLKFENDQMNILIDFLTKEKSLLFILINVALIPAICEEVLFRGFIFRLYSNSAGWIWGVVISGLLFGLYHIKLTQVIPLSLIGMLLAWFTYKSGSILPAMLAHLVNNGGSVVAAFYYPDFALSIGTETLPPSWVNLLSIILTVVLVYYFHVITSKSRIEFKKSADL